VNRPRDNKERLAVSCFADILGQLVKEGSHGRGERQEGSGIKQHREPPCT
jgi:hypothetical protein